MTIFLKINIQTIFSRTVLLVIFSTNRVPTVFVWDLILAKAVIAVLVSPKVLAVLQLRHNIPSWQCHLCGIGILEVSQRYSSLKKSLTCSGCSKVHIHSVRTVLRVSSMYMSVGKKHGAIPFF